MKLKDEIKNKKLLFEKEQQLKKDEKRKLEEDSIKRAKEYASIHIDSVFKRLKIQMLEDASKGHNYTDFNCDEYDGPLLEKLLKKEDIKSEYRQYTTDYNDDYGIIEIPRSEIRVWLN